MPSHIRSLPFTLLRTALLGVAALLTTETAATVIVAGDSARRPPRAAASGTLDLTPFRRRSAMYGRSFVQRGARLLARSARQGDEPMLASQALRLATMAREGASISHATMLQRRSLGFDLGDGRLLAIAQDTTLPPVLRMAAVRAGLAAVCLRTREMLVGVDASRYIGFRALADAVDDIPRANELTPLVLRALAAFQANGLRDDRVVQRAPAAGGWPTVWPWLVPPIVQHRAAACRAM